MNVADKISNHARIILQSLLLFMQSLHYIFNNDVSDFSVLLPVFTVVFIGACAVHSSGCLLLVCQATSQMAE